jgi:uncharacterized RmlC-like cupin family protein
VTDSTSTDPDETPADPGTQAWRRDLPQPDAAAERDHAERDQAERDQAERDQAERDQAERDQAERAQADDDLASPPWRRPLHHVRAGALDADTAQTKGMRRFEALSRKHGGTDKIWLGENHVGPEMKSGDHHHGEAETGIYVVAGHPEFVFLVDGVERRIETGPGDYVFVPPYVPHREENPHPEPAVVVLARSTQEGIVVNLPSLDVEVEIPQRRHPPANGRAPR